MIDISCDEKRNCYMDSPTDSLPDDLIRLSSSKKSVPKKRRVKRKVQVGRGRKKRINSATTTAKKRRGRKQAKKQVKRRARKTKVRRKQSRR